MLNEPPKSTVQAMGYVPSMPLKGSVAKSLSSLRYCETITVDPHKSGYIQYPAGGLLYRDGRLRYHITWASPVIFHDKEQSMGVFGVEGRYVTITFGVNIGTYIYIQILQQTWCFISWSVGFK
jgi:hypothetical protein